METIKNIAEYANASETLVEAVVSQYGSIEEFNELTEYISADNGYNGFIYYCDTLNFTNRNKSDILEMATAQAEEFGESSIFTMISNFGGINLTPEEVAEAIYNEDSENRTEVYNVLAWYALEETVYGLINYRESTTEAERVEAEIEAKEAELLEAEGELDAFELDPDKFVEEYNDSFEGEVEISGLIFDAWRIVKELDNTAYRCGLIDFVDTLDKTDNDEYRELEEIRDNIQIELDDLNEKLEELQEEE